MLRERHPSIGEGAPGARAKIRSWAITATVTASPRVSLKGCGATKHEDRQEAGLIGSLRSICRACSSSATRTGTATVNPQRERLSGCSSCVKGIEPLDRSNQ